MFFVLFTQRIHTNWPSFPSHVISVNSFMLSLKWCKSSVMKGISSIIIYCTISFYGI